MNKDLKELEVLTEEKMEERVTDSIESSQAPEVEKKPKSFLKIIEKVYDVVTDFLLVFVIIPAFIFLMFFGEVNGVSGTSMDSTLADGDRLVTIHSTDNMERGDIVIASPKVIDNRLIVKRVIAFGGDTIRLNNNEVYLNGELLEEDYVSHHRNDNFEAEYVIPEGYVWIMGDNRNNSLDSRTLGYIPVDDLEGIAVAKITPIKEFKLLK